MFTGIIETVGKVVSVEIEQDNKHFWIESTISNQLKIDQSIAHNGVCLTVIKLKDNQHCVTAIKETLEISNLNNLQPQTEVNLERCMQANGRFDGHIVQGHVDTIAKLTQIVDKNGSFVLSFTHTHPDFFTVEKGSVTINGISLTVINSSKNQFSVALIPYTWENTSMKTLQINDSVNVEFDILGKYVQQSLRYQAK